MAYHARVSAPSASDTFTRQSLVEEIHLQRRIDVAQARSSRRAKVRTRVLVVLASILAVAALAYGLKQFVESRRVERGLQAAVEPLAASSATTLDAALEALHANLEIASGHPQTLGRIAMVVTHQYTRALADEQEARAAAARAKAAGRPEGPLCEGIVAAWDGDLDQARRAYESAAEEDDPLVRADAAWLRGLVALGHPYDVTMEDGAIAQLETSLEEIAWAPNLRVLATLMARRGELDRALALTDEARTLAPEDAGLSVDEAFFKVLKAESVVGVLELVSSLDGQVRGADAPRMLLTKGLAKLHEGEPDAGAEALAKAWASLSPADNDGRVRIIEGLLSDGQVDRVESLREGVHLGSQADGLFDAWAKLARGHSKEALAMLETMPQTLPRVGHLQALALVEQRRYAEAVQWVEFARQRLPDRPDLAVAAARVATAMDDDRPSARKTLEALVDDHPRTYRAWTGLAEARLAALEGADADPGATEAALDALAKAIAREGAPAEAAYRLAEHHAARIFDEPEAAATALEHYRIAAQTPPQLEAFRAAYGKFLVQLARAREAKAVLEPLVDDTSLGPAPLLELAKVSSTDALLRGTPVDEGVRDWLTEAGRRGADPTVLELEWARYELARRNLAALDQARARLQSLVDANPRDVETRVLHASALLSLGELREARVTIHEGIRRTLRTLDGRLYVMLARVELASSQKRRAASLAYKGWRKMVREPLPVGALLDTAPFVAGLWTDLGQPKAAATIGRGLTFRAPVSPRAWVLRAGIELAEERAGAACTSADRAIELDDELPSGWELRGDCLMALGAREDALASYERGVELADGTVGARAIERKLAKARRRGKRR